MHLLIDVGNTRVKWAVIENSFNENVVVRFGSLKELSDSIQGMDTANTRVLLSAVNQTHDLMQLLNSNHFAGITSVKSKSIQAGISNSYEQPERMGIDRWLAMIASYKLVDNKGIVVVDAGSALTIDVVNQKGIHQGGYIVPGMAMAQSALFSNTEQVKRYDEAVVTSGRLNKLGNNTLQCVEYGVINQQVALIEKVTKQYPEYVLMITGGDSELLAEFLPTAVVDKNLVLKGLWQVRN
jgi:type III pantothenate kinase